jgi:hypothetical protein
VVRHALAFDPLTGCQFSSSNGKKHQGNQKFRESLSCASKFMKRGGSGRSVRRAGFVNIVPLSAARPMIQENKNRNETTPRRSG